MCDSDSASAAEGARAGMRALQAVRDPSPACDRARLHGGAHRPTLRASICLQGTELVDSAQTVGPMRRRALTADNLSPYGYGRLSESIRPQICVLTADCRSPNGRRLAW